MKSYRTKCGFVSVAVHHSVCSKLMTQISKKRLITRNTKMNSVLINGIISFKDLNFMTAYLKYYIFVYKFLLHYL